MHARLYCLLPVLAIILTVPVPTVEDGALPAVQRLGQILNLEYQDSRPDPDYTLNELMHKRSDLRDRTEVRFGLSADNTEIVQCLESLLEENTHG